jgi:hypothetical protein
MVTGEFISTIINQLPQQNYKGESACAMGIILCFPFRTFTIVTGKNTLKTGKNTEQLT